MTNPPAALPLTPPPAPPPSGFLAELHETLDAIDRARKGVDPREVERCSPSSSRDLLLPYMDITLDSTPY